MNSLQIQANDFDFFEKKIRPLLVERCYKCHSAESEKLKGGLLLDSKDGLRKGGDSGKPVIVPGDAERSLLIEAVRYKNEDLQMPPPKEGKLTEAQVADLVTWINEGAFDPRTNTVSISAANSIFAKGTNHWAFQPVNNPPVPSVKNKSWPQTSIDHFILSKLEANNLEPSARADKRTLIRRVTYDLTGLPPTPDEVDVFLKDKSTDAFAKVVDRLLASPRYGERWGRYWLDVARFADTKGYVYGGREETKFIHSYAYRDWVIRALNEDMPYDRFLKLQLAADQMTDADRNSLAAMGFLTLGRRFLGVVHDIIDDRIDTVTRGTQALTVSCARCHDHKFDPIPTKDYYSLYGVFAGSTEREVPLEGISPSAKAYLDFETELKRREEKFQTRFNLKKEEQNKKLRAKAPEYLIATLRLEKFAGETFYELLGPDDLSPVVVHRWHNYISSTKNGFNPVFSPWHAYAALSPKDFTNSARLIISSFTNATQKINPLVEKAFKDKPPASMRDVAETYGKLLAETDKKWNAGQQGSDKVALSKEEEEVRQILYAPESPASVPSGAIVDAEWYFDEPTRVELDTLHAQIDQWIIQSPGAPPHAVILEDRSTLKNPRVFKRGSPENRGDEVPRQFLEILAGPDRKPFAKGSGRLELAEAIASSENPLTARVMVNRVWLHHFGAGLVRTPSDFGTRSEPPTHPELLDWLAHYFMENGWSLKKLHRLMLLSAVYQQSSEIDSSGSVQKISFVSTGSKKSLSKNSSTIDPENKFLWRMNPSRLDFEAMRDSLLAVSGQLDLKAGGRAEDLFKPPFSKRRSIYGFIDRQFLPGPFRIFDFANPDMHSPQRSDTTVPQQALFFMNNAFVTKQAEALAAKIDAGPGAEKPEEKIRQFYRVVYQRAPTTAQLRSALQFIESAKQEVANESKQKPVESAWQYGYGEFDESANKLKSFELLPHFTGDAWQGGSAWPDPKLGWAQLTANGGHAGNDLQHAVIRRWVSPIDGKVSVGGTIKHERQPGEGIRAKIISSRYGLLGHWTLHNEEKETKVDSIEVKKGDTIDFFVSIHTSLNNNDFIWSPTIQAQGKEFTDANGYAREWNAKKEFSGPPPEKLKPLGAWEKFAQVLLLSNEFVFVD